MAGEQIDFVVRKKVAKWAHDVAGNASATAEQKAIAKTMIEHISPAEASQDSALAHVVFLVRTFAPGGDAATPDDVETTVGLIMADFVTLGAFQ